jgi:hypothetical protein
MKLAIALTKYYIIIHTLVPRLGAASLTRQLADVGVKIILVLVFKYIYVQNA